MVQTSPYRAVGRCWNCGRNATNKHLKSGYKFIVLHMHSMTYSTKVNWYTPNNISKLSKLLNAVLYLWLFSEQSENNQLERVNTDHRSLLHLQLSDRDSGELHCILSLQIVHTRIYSKT